MSASCSPAPATCSSPRAGDGHRLGGNYALAAARALLDVEPDAETIVRKSLGIAAEICVYTNDNVMIESLGG